MYIRFQPYPDASHASLSPEHLVGPSLRHLVGSSLHLLGVAVHLQDWFEEEGCQALKYSSLDLDLDF
ncbi:hypothetical protein L6452_30733 [Arctium lappa]|uniref:Uncharacterized protein n=1 Tax=Arctium lappa TaxID=4217 RepID=A0ACB8ZK63_ARCLA|nr:hypothetical protein L6452_30733 [Arctium lappa]